MITNFTEEDIAYLRTKNCFTEEFWSIYFQIYGRYLGCPEGNPYLPGEPILTVRAPAIQAQFVKPMC